MFQTVSAISINYSTLGSLLKNGYSQEEIWDKLKSIRYDNAPVENIVLDDRGYAVLPTRVELARRFLYDGLHFREAKAWWRGNVLQLELPEKRPEGEKDLLDLGIAWPIHSFRDIALSAYIQALNWHLQGYSDSVMELGFSESYLDKRTELLNPFTGEAILKDQISIDTMRGLVAKARA